MHDLCSILNLNITMHTSYANIFAIAEWYVTYSIVLYILSFTIQQPMQSKISGHLDCLTMPASMHMSRWLYYKCVVSYKLYICRESEIMFVSPSVLCYHSYYCWQRYILEHKMDIDEKFRPIVIKQNVKCILQVYPH